MENKRQPEPYMGTVKLGPKGQIVIPKEVREMFGIGPGDSLLLMAHPGRGIAMHRPSFFAAMADAIFQGTYREEAAPTEQLTIFAQVVQETVREEETK